MFWYYYNHTIKIIITIGFDRVGPRVLIFHSFAYIDDIGWKNRHITIVIENILYRSPITNLGHLIFPSAEHAHMVYYTYIYYNNRHQFKRRDELFPQNAIVAVVDPPPPRRQPFRPRLSSLPIIWRLLQYMRRQIDRLYQYYYIL